MDKNVKAVLGFVIVAAIVLAAFGYVFGIMTVGTIPPVQINQTTPTTSGPTAPKVVPMTQDEQMDMAFLGAFNDAGVMHSTTVMITTRNFSSAEGTRLTGLVVKMPTPGSLEMKTLRSVTLEVLATLDGTSASGSRFMEAHPKWMATVDAVLKKNEKFQPQKSLGVNTISGSGDSVRNFDVTNGGGFIITGEHSGDSNFIVHITNANGKVVDFVFNTIGDYSGRKIVNLNAGNYYVEIQSEGTWTLDITPS